MRTTVATLALLVIAATGAMAQVPRTMNFQGRIASATTPVNGPQVMRLRLYTSASGGTAVFDETQSVEFRNGVFTVAIGGSTPGGIPESVTFDQQYWLGVRIDGFNNNNELAPRFVLRSSPYSLRADIADSADRAATAAQADRASELDLPAIFNSDATSGNATLTVTNDGGGAGIHAQGEQYAIISDGVDSTARYFVTGESAGATAAPVTGALYRDNTPIAWATIQGDGTIVSDFGVASVGKPSDQGYEVVLDHPVRSFTFGGTIVPEFSPVIMVGGSIPPSGETVRVFTSWNYKRDPGGALNPRTIMVRIIDIQGLPAQVPFSIVVFGRPQ